MRIYEESAANLEAYAGVSIAFVVTEVLDVEVDPGLGGVLFRRRALEVPYTKDYDALDGGPARWGQRFDLSNWCLLAADLEGERVGGAAVAFDPADRRTSQDRTDLAVLWDIRVSTAHRGRGVGKALVAAATARATERGCSQLEVETQNVNVPACDFYLHQGFVLGAIHRFAYPSLPDEVQLLLYKALSRS